MICEMCSQHGGYEGEPEAEAHYLVTITAPPAEAEANAPEFLCQYHARQAADAYVGWGWGVTFELDPGEMQGCCHQHVTNPYVMSPTICRCGRTLTVRDRTWQVWVSSLVSSGTTNETSGG